MSMRRPELTRGTLFTGALALQVPLTVSVAYLICGSVVVTVLAVLLAATLITVLRFSAKTLPDAPVNATEHQPPATSASAQRPVTSAAIQPSEKRTP